MFLLFEPMSGAVKMTFSLLVSALFSGDASHTNPCQSLIVALRLWTRIYTTLLMVCRGRGQRQGWGGEKGIEQWGRVWDSNHR